MFKENSPKRIDFYHTHETPSDLDERVVRNFRRPTGETLNKFRDLDVSTVYEAYGQRGLMSREIRPVAGGAKLLGPALTVVLPAGDNLMLHKALTLARPGDVLVVAVRGWGNGAIWGGLLTTDAMAMGLAGIVTEGMARDSAFIREVRFPCFSRGITSEGTVKKSPGSVNVPVSCGGVLVNPGDIVLGDDDGVVVVPREDGDLAVEKARQRMEKEERIAKLLKSGKTTYELLGLDEDYRKLGIPETEE